MNRKLGIALLASVIGAGAATVEHLIWPTPVIAHGGGLDANGCHKDNKQGDYHCHQGSLAGRSFASKVAAEAVLRNPGPAVTGSAARPSGDKPAVASAAYRWRRVVRVIDGDTILLDRDERVRLIGVDTPETVDPPKPVQYFGKEASAFTQRLVEGKLVRLESDWDPKDKYGRTLSYVYLENGAFLNAEIIKQGYGFAYTQYPFKYAEEFLQLQREAREARRGLWAK